jgi:glycyl-tRNA synthetase
MPVSMEELVRLCKARGFVYPSAEIYGGFRSTYDYGPLGVLMARNVKDAWWRSMVQMRREVVGLDAAVLSSPKIWEASGHLQNFTDPLVDCRNCKLRWREDELPLGPKKPSPGGREPSGEMVPTCPGCGGQDFTEARPFNLMFKTFVGPVEDEGAVAFLRPETAQGHFVNFANVLQSEHLVPPFGTAQIGKSFRNEITPGNFVFRTREFEQMELEYYVPPAEADRWFDYWTAERFEWYVRLGIPRDMLRLRHHSKDELSHYSSATVDIEFAFPWGWGELEGIANRTDYDLKAHSAASGQVLEYYDPAAGERYVPYVIEPAAGVARAMMAFLIAGYTTDVVAGEQRTVLRLHPRIAPFQVAVLPLSKKESLVSLSQEVLALLQPVAMCDYDETRSIGRRYRRQDEIGTPLCVTVDFTSLEDKAVTVRDRDSTEQQRVPIDRLVDAVTGRLAW